VHKCSPFPLVLKSLCSPYCDFCTSWYPHGNGRLFIKVPNRYFIRGCPELGPHQVGSKSTVKLCDFVYLGIKMNVSRSAVRLINIKEKLIQKLQSDWWPLFTNDWEGLLTYYALRTLSNVLESNQICLVIIFSDWLPPSWFPFGAKSH